MFNNMKLREFSDFEKFRNRPCELFRSSDTINTKLYFTDKSKTKDDNKDYYFEILYFPYCRDLERIDNIFIKYPEDDYFTEMEGGSHGSSRGNMETSSCINVWKEHDFEKKIKIMKHDKNLIISLDSLEFNFMKRIGYTNGLFSEIETDEALDSKFLKLPSNLHELRYCLKSKEENPFYVIVYKPKYSNKYDDYEFVTIQNNEVYKFKIQKFESYRDGGTTIINVESKKGEIFRFFSPSGFDNTKSPNFDDIVLYQVEEDEKKQILKVLDIDFE